MRPSTFAVVVPTRDRADLVVGSMRRILGFGDRPEEVVVIDDGSTDDTFPRLTAIDGLTVVRGSGDGPAAARNLGVAATTSTWLIFLDDDDEPDEDWITAFRDLAIAHPNARYLTVGSRRTDGAVTTRQAPRQQGPAFNDVTALFVAGTFAIERGLYEAVGGFDDRLRHAEFTDLALRVFEQLTGQEEIAVDDAPRITHMARPQALRESQNPHLLTSASMLVLGKTDHLWRLDPTRHADQLATVGVAFIRCSRDAEGIRLLVAAARRNPSPRHLARAAASLLPPVRRRIWPTRVAEVPDQHVTASVVIPTYGRSHFLVEAVASVLRQTMESVEVIVVDDGSPTPVSLADDPRVRVVRQENAGVASARNRGVAEATGDFVFFLDDDDVFTPTRVEHAIRAHIASRADVVVCGQSWLGGGVALDRDLQGFVGDVVLDDITPHVGATSVRRAAAPKFDERYLASQDVEWWLRLAHSRQVHSIGDVDCLIRKHSGPRHSNGTAQRLECGIQLLDERKDYFDSHPRARSFRLLRLARSAMAIGDPFFSVTAATAAVRAQPNRRSVVTLVRATHYMVRDVLTVGARPETSTALLSTAHARDWVPRRKGPPAARLVPASRPVRIASVVAAHLDPPWAGYVRAVGARLARGRELDVQSAYGTFVVPRKDHTLLSPFFFEVLESAVISRLIRPGMTVIDIGANRGWYTAMAASLVGSSGRVVAVEPDVRMRALLAGTVAHNDWRQRVVVDPRAISDTVEVHAWTATTQGSLSRLAAPGERSEESVETTTLDQLLDDHGIVAPDLIKIDVEGAEPKVLRSCDFDRFGSSLPIIMFEFQPDMITRAGEEATELIRILCDAGYAILQLRPDHGDISLLDGEEWMIAEDTPRAGRNLLAVPADRATALVRSLFIDGPAPR